MLKACRLLGQRLKNAREKIGISQENLAMDLRLRFGREAPVVKSISNWERGKTTPKIHHLIMLSEALDEPCHEFVRGLRSDRKSTKGGDSEA